MAKFTRQGKNTERRVIVTLARHERNLTASEIIAKAKRNRSYIDGCRESGAAVRWEKSPGKYETLYHLRPEQFGTAKPGYKASPTGGFMLGDITQHGL